MWIIKKKSTTLSEGIVDKVVDNVDKYRKKVILAGFLLL